MGTQESGQVTGTKDKDYNVIWFVEQCLSNVLADFFRRAQETSRKGAEQGKDMLRSRLSS